VKLSSETNDTPESPAETLEGPATPTAEQPAAPAAPVAKSRIERIDTVLAWAPRILLVLVLLTGGAFALYVRQEEERQRLSTPVGRALDDLRRNVEDNPNDVVLAVRYGEALASAGMFREAINAFDQALKLDEEHTGAMLNMGMVLMADFRWNEAEPFFRKVTELTEGTEFQDLNARRGQAFFYLGQIAVEDGDYEEAVEYLRESLRIRRTASDTYFQLARAYHGLGDIDKAIENLYVALAFDPAYGEARFELGKFLAEQGKEASAAVEFRKVADKFPDAEMPIEALLEFGTVEQRISQAREAQEEGELQKAIEHATVAVAIEPASIEALLLRAELYEAAKRKADAVKDYEKILTLEPEHASATDALARLAPAPTPAP